MGRCSAKMEIEGDTVYPFSVECAVVELLEVRLAGCLPTDNGYILAIPSLSRTNLVDILSGKIPKPAKVVQLKDFPVDKRHNAKVDYRALRKRCGLGE